MSKQGYYKTGFFELVNHPLGLLQLKVAPGG
jgi:hypothetical protein